MSQPIYEIKFEAFSFKALPNCLTTLVNFLFVFLAGLGLSKIENDPSLLSYFKEGSDLRSGLDIMDKDWGTSGLKVVISDKEGRRFNDKEVFRNLWDLQTTLEEYRPVGNVVTIAELARAIRSVVGFKGEIRFDATRPDGMPQKILDSSKLSALGWEPRVEMDRALDELYGWYLHHKVAPQFKQGAA